MKHEITGTTMQVVEIDLDDGESLYSQTHAVAWMNDAITMKTNTGGGILKGFLRTLGGGTFFMTTFKSEGRGHLAFAPRFPGKIIAKRLQAGESLICRRESFLCAEESVSLELAFRARMGAGLFGGEGFLLQKVTGPGMVFLDLSGEVVEKDLAAGERLLVHAGHVGIQSATVGFDIQMVRGFSNILFGGEGLFFAELRGPGKIWLQSMPIMILAEEIGRHLPIKRS